jgi:hypothetical protein
LSWLPRPAAAGPNLTDILAIASNHAIGLKGEIEMKDLMLSLFLTTLVGAVSFSSVRAVGRQSSESTPPYENPEAYGVYSAVLSRGGQWDDSKSLVVLKELPVKEWPIGSPRDALHGDEEFRGNFASIFKSFEEANRQSLFLENHFVIQKSYQLVGLAELESAFHSTKPDARRDGWEGFRQTFPNSTGYLILSAVGFNPEKTIAIVFVDYRCGGLCSSARYYILQKRDKDWISYSPKGLQSETRGNS